LIVDLVQGNVQVLDLALFQRVLGKSEGVLGCAPIIGQIYAFYCDFEAIAKKIVGEFCPAVGKGIPCAFVQLGSRGGKEPLHNLWQLPIGKGEDSPLACLLSRWQ
jgi:hypothetical protein